MEDDTRSPAVKVLDDLTEAGRALKAESPHVTAQANVAIRALSRARDRIARIDRDEWV